MKRVAIFLYGITCYGLSVVTLLYGAGFIGNFAVPKSIDSPRDVPLATALALDLALLLAFSLQHSIMARPAFKTWWTQIIPETAERSTYMLLSSVFLGALFWFWQPMGITIWRVSASAAVYVLYGLYGIGWALLFYSTFLINHFDLFGLRQVWLQLVGRGNTTLPFRTPWLYRRVRHPLYVGWLTLIWSAPTMTLAHLVFALATTIYILVAIRFEERDLAAAHPEYHDYRRRVPMLIPSLRGPR